MMSQLLHFIDITRQMYGSDHNSHPHEYMLQHESDKGTFVKKLAERLQQKVFPFELTLTNKIMTIDGILCRVSAILGVLHVIIFREVLISMQSLGKSAVRCLLYLRFIVTSTLNDINYHMN